MPQYQQQPAPPAHRSSPFAVPPSSSPRISTAGTDLATANLIFSPSMLNGTSWDDVTATRPLPPPPPQATRPMGVPMLTPRESLAYMNASGVPATQPGAAVARRQRQHQQPPYQQHRSNGGGVRNNNDNDNDNDDDGTTSALELAILANRHFERLGEGPLPAAPGPATLLGHHGHDTAALSQALPPPPTTQARPRTVNDNNPVDPPPTAFPLLPSPTDRPGYHARVPVVSTYTFHTHASASHYAAGCVPFTLPLHPYAPPVLVPVAARTFRLPRTWRETGEVPAFAPLAGALALMDDAARAVASGNAAFVPVGGDLSPPRVAAAAEVLARLGAVSNADKDRDADLATAAPGAVARRWWRSVGARDPVLAAATAVYWPGSAETATTPDALDAVDALVADLNGLLRDMHDTPSWAAMADLVMGILTGWAHHLVVPPPCARAQARIEQWLESRNRETLAPRGLYLRNPFDNGLSFLEIELLE
ncbi:hypothetical protein BC828DRAFT_377953 [Blastocladiella britannica]|nr:hypothetical protein BC828DRAFT_377953 [Blastocladiella britannica]